MKQILSVLPSSSAASLSSFVPLPQKPPVDTQHEAIIFEEDQDSLFAPNKNVHPDLTAQTEFSPTIDVTKDAATTNSLVQNATDVTASDKNESTQQVPTNVLHFEVTSKTPSSINPFLGPFLSHDNEVVSPVTDHKFNGHNYLQWSQSVVMYIGGKGKEEYLTGEISAPKQDDPTYKTWKADNHMIKSWLISSMNNDIGENFLLYATAKELWDVVKDSYSSSENTSKLFAIEATLYDLHQDDTSHSILQHSHTLLARMDLLKNMLGNAPMILLYTSRIMSTKALPKVKEAFSKVRLKESEKRTRDALGVTIAENLDTTKRHAGKFMESLQIGNQSYKVIGRVMGMFFAC
ncbi:hypothetical protein Pint_10989 [Pistacia integerrima]|uniref:Uncharacterized protein n=1 Tax=Pistacia integerrima TaxID=434235 RepID=A0ACC0XHS3_9ROSI|nr:hypothetical protein Pint_10989 [Pistacia integerrima]